MKIVYENLKPISIRPEDMSQCLLLFNDKTTMIGIYDKSTDSFFDGIMGHLKVDDTIIGWKDINECIVDLES